MVICCLILMAMSRQSVSYTHILYMLYVIYVLICMIPQDQSDLAKGYICLKICMAFLRSAHISIIMAKNASNIYVILQSDDYYVYSL